MGSFCPKTESSEATEKSNSNYQNQIGTVWLGSKNIAADKGEWLLHYNTQRTHQGKMCCGRTPFDTMTEGKQIWKEKFLNQT